MKVAKVVYPKASRAATAGPRLTVYAPHATASTKATAAAAAEAASTQPKFHKYNKNLWTHQKYNKNFLINKNTSDLTRNSNYFCGPTKNTMGPPKIQQQ
jgi:hypothetical protein